MKLKKIKRFIKRLCLSDSQLKEINTNLIEASDENNIEMVKFWVEKGAMITCYARECIRFSIYNGNIEITKYLLENSNVLRHADTHMSYAFDSRNEEMINFLVSLGLSFKEKENLYLQRAAEDEALNIISFLLKSGTSPNGEKGLPLVNACANGNLESVKLLLNHGADVNINKDEPLRCAASNARWDILKYLIEHNAKIDAWQNIALRKAALYGNLEFVQYLVLEKKQDINIIIEDNETNDNVKFWAQAYKQSKDLQEILNTDLNDKNMNKTKKQKI